MQSPPFFAPFRTRLILLVLLVVLPAFALVLHSNLEQRQLEKSRAKDGALAISQLAAANQESFLKNARQLLATLGQFSFLVLNTNRAFCQNHLANLRKLLPNYLNFGLIETNGEVFCSAEPLTNAVYAGDRAYFKRVFQTQEFSIGDFQVGRLTGESSLNFGYPVFDEQGKLRRVVYAALKLAPLSEAISSIRLPEGASITVFDRNGCILARYPDSARWVGQALSNAPVVQRILTEHQPIFQMPGVDGVPRLHAVTAIRDRQSPSLFVSVGIPLSVSFAEANAALVRNLMILALVALLVLLLARLYSQRYFLSPVQALATAARRLAEGDLSARAGVIQASPELAQLGRAFDEMAGSLQRRTRELELANEEIQKLNRGLEGRVRERTAQLESLNRELEAFSYSVSHDLRAPLRHIDGFASLLAKSAGGALSDKARHYLAQIVDSSKQMAGLIEDLLAFSRMARAELRRTNVPLAGLVEEAINALESESAGRKIVWKRMPLPEVEADRAMLRQAFMNLLSNAIKYTRPCDPAEIEIGCQNGNPDEMVIFVRDNGVGFDMAYAEKLFGVFQRLHADDEFEGTGIGLANVRRIVSRHGGRTWAEGQVNGGATFYFSLPTNKASK